MPQFKQLSDGGVVGRRRGGVAQHLLGHRLLHHRVSDALSLAVATEAHHERWSNDDVRVVRALGVIFLNLIQSETPLFSVCVDCFVVAVHRHLMTQLAKSDIDIHFCIQNYEI